VTIHTRLNNGKWIVDCPNCNGAEIVYPGHPFICGNINHGQQNYNAFVLQLAIVRALRKGKSHFNHKDWNIPIPIATAKKRVIDNGNTYDVTWPSKLKKSQIEALTKIRPQKAKNWPVKGDPLKGIPFDYNENIDELINENIRHGLGG